MEDNNIEINPNFKKLEQHCLKNGYRDGISDGKDSNFQCSFDTGYEQGFKNGFSLGFYKGLITAKNTINKLEQPISDELLQQTSRGGCVVCKNELSTIPEVILKQTEESALVINSLHSKYGDLKPK